MKRGRNEDRDDKDSYLGGDISNDISFVETEDGSRPATKAERNARYQCISNKVDTPKFVCIMYYYALLLLCVCVYTFLCI